MKVQYSKIFTTIFSVIMVPYSVRVVERCLDLAEMAIASSFLGALPYVTAIVGFVEAAVICVAGFYFGNSGKEKVANARYGVNRRNIDY